jgi:ribonuclease BN (tRNA processing enzyme)
MEIVFLGTGGGRINLIKQIRGTGGFRINSRSANIHVDPGPGALIHSIELKQNPLELDAVIATHNHVDHISDAMVLIEAMTNYGLKKRGTVIASRNAIEENGISPYHQARAGTVYVAQYGERKRFENEKGSFEIEILLMKHEEPTTFGFRLYLDGGVLGYISDTEFTESLGRDFTGCDCLIVNCIKPEGDTYKGHLRTADVAAIVKVAKPKTCIITHLGLKMLKAGPSKEAEIVERESGVKTLAARDGMRFEF